MLFAFFVKANYVLSPRHTFSLHAVIQRLLHGLYWSGNVLAKTGKFITCYLYYSWTKVSLFHSQSSSNLRLQKLRISGYYIKG